MINGDEGFDKVRIIADYQIMLRKIKSQDKVIIGLEKRLKDCENQITALASVPTNKG